jgi:superfamily II DNA or RNA helicase
VICSLFFKALIAEFSTDALQAKTHKRQPFLEVPRALDPVTDMFWGGVAVQFTGFGGDSMAPAIQKWLSIFEAGSHDWRPILEVRADDAGNFALDLSLEPTSGAVQVPVPLSTFLSDAHYTTDRTAVLQALYILAGVVPPVHQLLANGGGLPAPIDPEQILEVLLAQLPLVELLGIQVRLPRELKELVRPKLSVRIDTKGQEQAAFSLGDIFAFDWQVALGDVFLTPEEFLKLVRAQHGLVMLRGQYVLIQPDELERLRKRLERGPRPGPHQLFHAALTGEFEGAPAKLSGQVLQLIESITAIQNLPVPAGIQATLRPYQQGGFEWMYKNAQLGMGSVIADDMGLGKTLQVLCLLEQLRSEGKLRQAPALAVVPTSLLANWKKEAERFAPHLNVHLFHGADRKLPTEAVDLMVTTYGVVRSDLAKLKKRNWSLAVIDEAQNIKNPATAQSKAIRELPAPLRIAMSGTPVENRLSDYWSIMDFALPGYLGTQKEFRADYGIPITNFRDTDALRRFHLITSPFILRRLKTDPKVISDLPDKIIQNQWSVLTQAQAAIYEGVVQECMHAITAAETAIARQGLVLKMLTALKQVCNHPAQYLGKGAPDSAESGKAQVFLQLVESIVAQHEKCLVFTQYTEMANLLVQMLRQELGVEASLLHGGLSPKQREALVTEFQTASHRKVFILSLKAGGTGLNLTAANHVIHYDLWWNPAVENQATDRAFRIGQKKNVLVHRLICKGTMEERIDELINNKRDLAALAVAGGEKWIGELGNKDLRELVALTM